MKLWPNFLMTYRNFVWKSAKITHLSHNYGSFTSSRALLSLPLIISVTSTLWEAWEQLSTFPRLVKADYPLITDVKWAKFAQNQAKWLQNQKSSHFLPTRATYIILRFSWCTTQWDYLLKKFWQSEQNSEFCSNLKVYTDKKTPCMQTRV